MSILITALLITQLQAGSYGAKGNAKALEHQCAMVAGSNRLVCTKQKFMAQDIGKVIAVYGAGPTVNGFTQPLSARVLSMPRVHELTLSAIASTSVSNSPRVVYGSDDTAAIQAAVDAAARRGGASVQFAARHYLVQSVNLPCAAIGKFKFSPQSCALAYNGIGLVGAGPATILENWNTETTTDGLISLGDRSEIPALDPGNTRLRDIRIADMTLRQVLNARRAVKTLYSYATTNVELANLTVIGNSYECLYMGGGAKSTFWHVHHNTLSLCGLGGPAYSLSTSALNLNGEDWTAHDNLVTNSGQGVEMGSRRGQLFNNTLDGTLSPVTNNHIGINIGSTGNGIWENAIFGNAVKGWGIVAANGNGTLSRTSINGNMLIDSFIVMYSGRNTNTVVEGIPDTVVHGTSFVRNNTFSYPSGGVASFPFQFGELNNPQAGLENYIISGNAIAFPSVNSHGLLAIAGPHTGLITIQSMAVTGSGGRSTGFHDISTYNGTARSVWKVQPSLILPFQWRIEAQGALDTWDETIPANVKYSDVERYKFDCGPNCYDRDPNNPPSVGAYAIGTVIHHYSRSAVNDWNWVWTGSAWLKQ